MVTADVSNGRVAADLNLDHSMVSRLRSGTRQPSVDTMATVAAVYDWPIEIQVVHRAQGDYAEALEAMLAQRFGEREDGTPPAIIGTSDR